MTGPEHYKEAERLATAWQESVNEIEAGTDAEMRAEFEEGAALAAQTLAAAQVHATLALAAATAYPAVKDWMGDEARDGAGWSAATR